MTVESTTALAVAMLSLATFVRSAFGFGEALIAVPLMALIMPVTVAAPVAVLVSITVAAVVVVQDWRSIHFRSAARLVAASVVGTPIGLLLLVSLPEAAVKAALGVLIAVFSAHALGTRFRGELRDDRRAWLFGLVAGVLGGAYGMNGPPLVLFGTLRRWSPQHFRATLQAYFLPASAAVLAGYAAAGLWTPTVTRVYLQALPFVILSVLAGRALNRRFETTAFLRVVHAALVLIGIVLVMQSLAGTSGT
jgi:uncharacterized membrane protein YfcA